MSLYRRGYTERMVTKKPTRRKPDTKACRPVKRGTKSASLWQRLAAIGASVPAEDRAQLPRDAAEKFDEYFDGAA